MTVIASPRRRLTADARRRLEERADRAVFEVLSHMEHVELKQHARDRAEEREPIEMGLIDLGGDS